MIIPLVALAKSATPGNWIWQTLRGQGASAEWDYIQASFIRDSEID